MIAGGGSCQRHGEGPGEGIRRGYREQPRLHQQQKEEWRERL